MRQDWATQDTAKRAQVHTLSKRFRREAPVVEAIDLVADAVAWTLFAMYCCSASHTAALFNKTLHPQTGLMPWISQFHVDLQRIDVRTIKGRFAHYLGVTSDR